MYVCVCVMVPKFRAHACMWCEKEFVGCHIIIRCSEARASWSNSKYLVGFFFFFPSKSLKYYCLIYIHFHPTYIIYIYPSSQFAGFDFMLIFISCVYVCACDIFRFLKRIGRVHGCACCPSTTGSVDSCKAWFSCRCSRPGTSKFQRSVRFFSQIFLLQYQ